MINYDKDGYLYCEDDIIIKYDDVIWHWGKVRRVINENKINYDNNDCNKYFNIMLNLLKWQDRLKLLPLIRAWKNIHYKRLNDYHKILKLNGIIFTRQFIQQVHLSSTINMRQIIRPLSQGGERERERVEVDLNHHGLSILIVTIIVGCTLNNIMKNTIINLK